jgi:hypothetical protein
LCLQNRRGLTEIASHEISACRHQLPRSVTILLTGQRLDAMSPGQQCACNRASLLAGSAGDQNASFGALVSAPLVFHWSNLGMPQLLFSTHNANIPVLGIVVSLSYRCIESKTIFIGDTHDAPRRSIMKADSSLSALMCWALIS